MISPEVYASAITQPPTSPVVAGSVDALEGALLGSLAEQGVESETATLKHWYFAVAHTLRNRLMPKWEKSKRAWNQPNGKRAHLLSIEWLPGPHTYTALQSAHLTEAMNEALRELLPKESGLTPEQIYGYERDPGLGNGGLGRLMSCFLDSAASRHAPVMGYGLFYDKGFFRQDVHSGHQEELPDNWLVDQKNPWGVIRPERIYYVPFFGEHSNGEWRNAVRVPFVAHDGIVPSFDGEGANTLRLWRLAYKIETGDPEKDALITGINETLYPSNHNIFGQNLRFMQGYALVGASLRDILDCHFNRHKKTVDEIPEAVAIQLNDTHPAIAIPELIRFLVDERGVEWKKAVELTRETCFYTNHTVMPEALEKWHVDLARYIVPRHFAILERLQNDLMNEVQAKGQAEGWSQQEIWDRQGRVSIIHEGQIHMDRLAAYFTKQTNGVAAMHSELVAKELLPDLTILRGPDAVTNRTNGISPRSWLIEANPRLANLMTSALGSEAWINDLSILDARLGPLQEDTVFREQFHRIKRGNKERLAAHIAELGGPVLDPEALFDIQVKRIHEYKRQFMNALHTVSLYLDILDDPAKSEIGVVKIFAGKAAPSYKRAKDHIELINWLAGRINNDPRVGDRLKVYFMEDYRVSLAKVIIPAADLSEQISLAGKEASGTSNMKFALNGALTIGTLDGANVEIRQRVGEENFLLFGHTKPELSQLAGNYDPMRYIGGKDSPLYRALLFLQKETPFGHLTDGIWQGDQWRIAADFVGNWQNVRGYHQAQAAARQLYTNDPAGWLTMAIANTRGGSHFSSDATLGKYVNDTWKIKPNGLVSDITAHCPPNQIRSNPGIAPAA